MLAGFTMFRIDAQGACTFRTRRSIPPSAGAGSRRRSSPAAMTDAARRGETVGAPLPVVTAYLQKHDVPGLTVEWPELAVPE